MKAAEHCKPSSCGIERPLDTEKITIPWVVQDGISGRRWIVGEDGKLTEIEPAPPAEIG